MATWKKVVVSGSDVSQLNNDAGYLTVVTSPTRNAFASASVNGTVVIADSPSGSLAFASSSGQGLNISAASAPDTITFGLSSIPNASLLNSSITIAGNSTALGGTVTQAQILAGSGTWSGSAQLPAGVVSGSSQVLNGTTIHSGSFFNGITVVSGSSQISYTGLSNIPGGIVSASSLGSGNQGEVYLVTNGVQQSAIDLGLQTTDSPSFLGVTAGNITVGVTNDNTINTTSGDLTIQPNVVLNGNLTVIGTASFQQTSNLQVADRFILLASGSNSTGDGGIVVQQATQNVGELFGFDSGATRWAVTSSFTATTGTYTPDAFMAAVTSLASTNPNTSGPDARFNAKGNIYVATGAEDIWIYS